MHWYVTVPFKVFIYLIMMEIHFTKYAKDHFTKCTILALKWPMRPSYNNIMLQQLFHNVEVKL